MRRPTALALFASLAALGCTEGSPWSHTPSTIGPDDVGCVDPSAGAPMLGTEAGFLEVPFAGGVGPIGRMRMFYSFRPADVAPEKAPLVLLFNGGPGYATTGGLLAFGTGPMTLSGDVDGGTAPFANSASWTRFANLLYLDAPLAGFSYGLDEKGCEGHTDEDAYLSDAGSFVHALLDFLDGHRALVNAPIVLAGESYGGARVALMLYLLQHYADPSRVFPEIATQLPWLRDRVQAHLDAARPCHVGQVASSDEVAAQFGEAVVIQGNFFGYEEFAIERPLAAQDPVGAKCTYFEGMVDCDPGDVRQTVAEKVAIDARMAASLRDAAGLETLLGVVPADIDGLSGPARTGAWRTWDGDPLSVDEASAVKDEAALRHALGQLAPGDAYWLMYGRPCGKFFLGDTAVLQALIESMPTTALFFTRAEYDFLVYAAAYPQSFATAGLQADVREDLPAGAARPGVLEVHLADGPVVGVRFPRYAAGHMVAATAGPELAEDVRAWLGDVGVLKPAP